MYVSNISSYREWSIQAFVKCVRNDRIDHFRIDSPDVNFERPCASIVHVNVVIQQQYEIVLWIAIWRKETVEVQRESEKNEIDQGSSLKQRSFSLPVNKSKRSQRIGLLLFFGKTRQPVWELLTQSIALEKAIGLRQLFLKQVNYTWNS